MKRLSIAALLAALLMVAACGDTSQTPVLPTEIPIYTPAPASQVTVMPTSTSSALALAAQPSASEPAAPAANGSDVVAAEVEAPASMVSADEQVAEEGAAADASPETVPAAVEEAAGEEAVDAAVVAAAGQEEDAGAGAGSVVASADQTTAEATVDEAATEEAAAESVTETPGEAAGADAVDQTAAEATVDEAATEEAAAETADDESIDPTLAGLPEEIAALLPSADPVHGETLTVQNACIGCHNSDPSIAMAGPTWHNVAETAATRVEGQSAAAYLYASIVNPDEYVVDGYVPGVMIQNYADLLNPEDLADIVAYLLTQKGME